MPSVRFRSNCRGQVAGAFGKGFKGSRKGRSRGSGEMILEPFERAPVGPHVRLPEIMIKHITPDLARRVSILLGHSKARTVLDESNGLRLEVAPRKSDCKVVFVFSPAKSEGSSFVPAVLKMGAELGERKRYRSYPFSDANFSHAFSNALTDAVRLAERVVRDREPDDVVRSFIYGSGR